MTVWRLPTWRITRMAGASRLLLCAALPCLLLWPAARAEAAGVLKLSHVEMWMRGDARVGKLYAENVGDSMLYLEIEQRLLLNPGEQPEQLVPVEQVERPTLLAAPTKLALGPGQRYRIALRELMRPQTPQVWRLTFRPKESVLLLGESMDGVAAPLSVSIGYGVLVYQMPD